MSQLGVNSLLRDMQALSSEVTGKLEKGQSVNTVVGKGGFAEELQNTFTRINDLQKKSGEQLEAFQAGKPGVELHQVMIDSQKASVAFQFGAQVRNRLVTAYKDIMNMPV